MITADLNSLKTRVDDLQSRLNTLEKFSNPALVMQELNLINSLVRIAAWNCRGLSNGLPYCELLADSHDMVIISEH